MRCITYAGEHLVTSSAVADLITELTAALAASGQAEAVQIPIYPEGEDYPGSPDALKFVRLVIGVGTDVLSSPYVWNGPDPDFAEAATDLQSKLDFHAPKVVVTSVAQSPPFDYEAHFVSGNHLDPDPPNF